VREFEKSKKVWSTIQNKGIIEILFLGHRLLHPVVPIAFLFNVQGKGYLAPVAGKQTGIFIQGKTDRNIVQHPRKNRQEYRLMIFTRLILYN
jgi:hypothetical protein